MQWLRRTFDGVRPAFEEGGRLATLKPVFEATDHFFFAPASPTQAAPHVRDPLDVKRFMATVIVALAPATLASVYFFGLRALAVIAVSYAVGGAVETLVAVIRKEEINEGFLVTGLVFPLTLPPGLPLWMVGVGVAFGVLVGKELFGGTGRNLFNPALVGRCFLAIGYPAAMTTEWIKPGGGLIGRLGEYATTTDAVSAATPLVLAKQGEFAPLSDLFLGNVTGSMGETSALAVILGGAFLLLTRVANWRTVAGGLGSFVLLGAALQVASPGAFGPVGWHLFAGGLLFAVFFMATDPVTSPATGPGKWAYGILIGTLTLLIRNLTGFVEGAMFAILLGNIAAPLLDEMAVGWKMRRLCREG